MLSLVTAAEQQYRFDTASRAREDAVLRSIRERQEAISAEPARARAPRAVPVASPRPVGAQRSTTAASVCTAA